MLSTPMKGLVYSILFCGITIEEDIEETNENNGIIGINDKPYNKNVHIETSLNPQKDNQAFSFSLEHS